MRKERRRRRIRIRIRKKRSTRGCRSLKKEGLELDFIKALMLKLVMPTFFVDDG